MLVWFKNQGLEFDAKSEMVLEEIRVFSKATADTIGKEYPDILEQVCNAMKTGVLLSARQ